MPKESSREERLQKIIARAGIASRRAAERMIVEGRVQVDGRVVKELGAKADPSRSDVRVDGRRIRLGGRRRYIVLNKPRGYVTTRSDPGGRPTVMELLPHSLRTLYPVGRLDMSSTGLLLMTDDGDFAQHVGHPRFGVEKTYLVTVRGTPTDRTLARARNGIRVEGESLRVQSVHVLDSRRREKVETARLNVVLIEGKNREVRRLFKALGHPVLDLHRSKVGTLSDRGLPEGMFRPLSSREVRQLKSPQPERSGSAASRAARARRARSEGRPDGSPQPAAVRSEPVERRTRTRTRRERPLSDGSGSAARARRAPAFAKASARPHRSSKSEGGRSKERPDTSPQSERPSSRTPRERPNASYGVDSPRKVRRSDRKSSFEGDSSKTRRDRPAKGSRRPSGKGKSHAASKISSRSGRGSKTGA
jgi:pseudouridine synthase